MESYPYGMNGQEKDNEVAGNGNIYTAEYWEYDSRIGRRWEQDPVVKPWESPYACFLDNPIFYSDPTGEDPPEKLTKGQRFKNWFVGNSYKNKANDFAVENNIDEALIREEKGRVDFSVYDVERTGSKEGVSEYTLKESTISFHRGEKVTRTIGEGSDLKFALKNFEVLDGPEKEYGTIPDIGLSPIVSGKNLKDLAKLVKLGNASLKMTLPAWKKVAIDMEHVLSGHTLGGSRVSKLKSLFPKSYNAKDVERTIRSAYKNVHTKLETQGDRMLLQGTADNGMNVEMWLNKATKTIETAYPK